jgi:hypothetical protein
MKRLNDSKTALLLLPFAFGLSLGAASANADFTFGEPVNLGPVVNTSSGDTVDCFSSDGLEMYFDSDRPGGQGQWDLWVTTRPTSDSDWGTPVNLGSAVNSGQPDYGATLSSDGLELYFSSYNRSGGYGGLDIWLAKRATISDPWSQAVNIGPKVNTTGDDGCPSIFKDGLEMYLTSNRPGSQNYDIWVTRRSTKNTEWGTPSNLGSPVNSGSIDDCASVAEDGLTLYFTSNRPGGYGAYDIWVTKRKNAGDNWGPPKNLGPKVNSPGFEYVARMSIDGRTLYFGSERPGGLGGRCGDIWQAPILPIVDFNGDGKVDGLEVRILSEHLGQYDALCDIGPMPWGDGIVDVNDQIVLDQYIGKELYDPTLVNHWSLDEAQGIVAHDTVGRKDGFAIGGPVWQPTGGKVNGGLEFDGFDDYVSTRFFINPAQKAFSIFAWVKGGAPGQVIISQMVGLDWLSADPLEGKLMATLSASSSVSAPRPLTSQSVIADGQWHRVGLVWDGANRALYVDDVEVAKDAQAQLADSAGSLYFGAGKNLEPDSFWSGLIDDVRIYNRPVKP